MRIPLRAILRELERRNVSFAESKEQILQDVKKIKEFESFLEKTVRKLSQSKGITRDQKKQIIDKIKTVGQQLPSKLARRTGDKLKIAIEKGIAIMNRNSGKPYKGHWVSYIIQTDPEAADVISGIVEILRYVGHEIGLLLQILNTEY